MATNRFGNWLQVGANVGIIVGLGLVAFQMKQTNDLAAAEMSSVGLELLISHSLTMAGEQPDEAMFRVLITPDVATDHDYFVADQVYRSLLDQLFRIHLNRREGLVNLSAPNMAGPISKRAYWFSSPYGISYLDQRIEELEPFVTDSQNSREYLDTLRSLRDAASGDSVAQKFAKRKARNS